MGRCIGGLIAAGMMIPSSIASADPIGEYRLAMAMVPIEGLMVASDKLKRGEYDIANRAFIPLPAEFAAMANAECRILREDRARISERIRAARDPDFRRAVPPVIGKNPVERQKMRADELARAGYTFFGKCSEHSDFVRMAKQRQVPTGSIHLWAIEEIWTPPVASAKPQDKEQAA